jgi:hypothetical protein
MKSLTPTKTRVKPELEARLGPSVPGCHTLFLHRGKECSGYYLRRLPSDFGIAFGLDKFGAQGSGSYNVLLDVEKGHHTCEWSRQPLPSLPMPQRRNARQPHSECGSSRQTS